MVLKDDSASKVVVVDLQSFKLIVKQFRFKNFKKKISRTIRRSYAEKTWHNARLFLELGVETVIPVAFIEDRLGFLRLKSFFIGTHIPGQNGRAFFNDPNKDAGERRLAAKKLVRSLIDLHSKNIFLGDTKDNNVIIGPEGVFWVDLEEVSRPGTRWIKRKKEMREWQVFFYNWRNNLQNIRLFYNLLSDSFDLQSYWEIVHQVALYRDKRLKMKEIQARLANAIENPGEVLEQVLKIENQDNSFDSKWVKIEGLPNLIMARSNNRDSALVCKVFKADRKKVSVKCLFQPGRGEQVVRNEQMMFAAGFDVPETIYWEKLDNKEIVIFRAVEGTPLTAWLRQHPHDSQKKREVLKRLGEEIAALHLTGFAPKTLQLDNVMLKKEHGVSRFVFTDNEDTVLYRKIPSRLRLLNLCQINEDATLCLRNSERLRMFRAYQGVFGAFDKRDEKRVIAKIEKMTAKRLDTAQ